MPIHDGIMPIHDGIMPIHDGIMPIHEVVRFHGKVIVITWMLSMTPFGWGYTKGQQYAVKE